MASAAEAAPAPETPSSLLDLAEELLVTGSFAEAYAAAERVLAWQPRSAVVDLYAAAAAVLLQAGRLSGQKARSLRTSLESAFGSLRGVPPEALLLWARQTVSDNQAVLARDTLVTFLGNDAADTYPLDAVMGVARCLCLDVLCGALRDPVTANRWLSAPQAAQLPPPARMAIASDVRRFAEAALAAEAEEKAAVEFERQQAAAARANMLRALQQAGVMPPSGAQPKPAAAPKALEPAAPAAASQPPAHATNGAAASKDEPAAAPPPPEAGAPQPPPDALASAMSLVQRSCDALRNTSDTTRYIAAVVAIGVFGIVAEYSSIARLFRSAVGKT